MWRKEDFAKDVNSVQEIDVKTCVTVESIGSNKNDFVDSNPNNF